MEHYQKEQIERNQQNETKKKMMLQGTGPLAKIVVLLVESAVLLLKMVTNMFIDLASDGFDFAFNMFFSDFKGFLVKGVQEKKGICFDLLIFRTALTLMLPPVGVFLARGLSGWYNIILCSFFCFFKYIPGVLYAFIVIHNAKYANLYHRFKKRKRELREGKKQDTGFLGQIDLVPIVVFGLCLGLAIMLVLWSMKYSPTIETDLAILKEKLNNLGIINTGKIDNLQEIAKTGSIKPLMKETLLERALGGKKN